MVQTDQTAAGGDATPDERAGSPLTAYQGLAHFFIRYLRPEMEDLAEKTERLLRELARSPDEDAAAPIRSPAMSPKRSSPIALCCSSILPARRCGECFARSIRPSPRRPQKRVSQRQAPPETPHDS